MSKTKGCGITQVVNVQDLEAMATAGMSPNQIAQYYGLTRQGMVRVIKDNPELSEAFHNGLNKVLVKCVNVLLNKVEQGDTFSAIYLLNNRFGWMEEKYRKEKPVNDFPQVKIYLPDNYRDKKELKDETVIEVEV